MAGTARSAVPSGGNWSDIMTRLRRFAIAVLAAATVTVGSLGVVSTASAMPKDCYQSSLLARAYWSTGVAFASVGAWEQANYWWGRADQLMVGC